VLGARQALLLSGEEAGAVPDFYGYSCALAGVRRAVAVAVAVRAHFLGGYVFCLQIVAAAGKRGCWPRIIEEDRFEKGGRRGEGGIPTKRARSKQHDPANSLTQLFGKAIAAHGRVRDKKHGDIGRSVEPSMR